jgi:glutathione synthase/RimK-type ligase-like ATP-grasp enzyme
MPRLAYVTCTPLPDDPDLDLPHALAALRQEGWKADAVRWDDPDVDWAGFDVVVVRSPWDYAQRREDFLAWAAEVAAATMLLNPYRVLEANTHKGYLRALDARGVPVVPTAWYAPGDDPVVRLEAGRLVVKPVVSAGARDTILTADRAEAERHLADLLAAGREAMVQPYLDAVDAEGEVSAVFLGGRPSHAVRKVPALTEGGHGDARSDHPLGEDLVAAAEAVLAAAEPGWRDLVYARVDVVRVDGVWTLMELELTEPTLFLDRHPEAPARLAGAVGRAYAAAVRS